MLIRSVSIIFLILSLTNCASFHKKTGIKNSPTALTSPIKISKHTKAKISTPSQMSEQFTRVLVHGNIDVTLYTGSAKSGVRLYGDSRNFQDVKTTVQNGLLHITLGKGYPHFGRERAEIRTRYLTSFEYHGTGNITAGNLQSGKLDLAIDNRGDTTIKGKINLHRLLLAGSGHTRISGITGHGSQIQLMGAQHVQLAGIMDITSLNMADDSSMSLYWVKTNVLKIRAKDKAFIQMAGVVGTLDLILKDKAHFNGRYLRGTDVFVKTFDHSIADICSIKTQHALASGASNIYFHNLPKMKADFMAWNGSVLDMREWETPERKEYTSYNR